MPDILRIPHNIAKPFIEKWHYSSRCPTGKNIFFGWYIDGAEYGLETDLFGKTLYAIADYGIGVNPYQSQSLTRMTGIEIDTQKLLELKRLCRVEPKVDKLPLTMFIAKCHRILDKEGYCYVVAFSDPAYGHSGGIYKAANFKYLGKTNPETHAIEADGTLRHRRLYFRYARRNNVSVAQARQELGLSLKKTMPKDRWFIQIHKKP